MTVLALVISILLSAAALAWGYADAGLPSFTRVAILLGMAWLIAIWRRWNWFSAFALFTALMLSGIGLWIELPPGWMAAGALFGLLAWDLADFRRRLRFIPVDDELRGLERRHLIRISFLALIGAVLSSVAMVRRAQFTFEWIVFLILVAVLSLTQLVKRLKNK